MQLFDTHAHLDDEQFAPVRDEVLARARQAGVVGIVAVGTTAESSRTTTELAAQYDVVHAAVGIQPNYCGESAEGDWDSVVTLSRASGVVAIGETGLDRYWDYTPFEVQRDYFDRHLRLSQQLDLPCVIHMRDCGDDMLAMLSEARRRGPLRGVMHSFTGDRALADECLQLGMHISFAGMVTYKKSDELRQVAASIPRDRLLVETDAPYLSPHPVRGVRPNEPALIVHTVNCLAAVRGISAEEFAGLTTSNARQLFGITQSS